MLYKIQTYYQVSFTLECWASPLYCGTTSIDVIKNLLQIDPLCGMTRPRRYWYTFLKTLSGMACSGVRLF